MWKRVRCTGVARHAPIPHLQQVEAFFGPDKRLSAILIPHVAGFLKSDALLKMHGDKERSEITVKKTVRVFRTFLVWAKEQGYIAKLPLPKDVPTGRSLKNDTEVQDAGELADDPMLQPSSDLDQSVEAFAVRLRALGRSEHTISSYLRDLRLFLRVLSDEHPLASLRDITPAMIDAALNRSIGDTFA